MAIKIPHFPWDQMLVSNIYVVAHWNYTSALLQCVHSRSQAPYNVNVMMCQRLNQFDGFTLWD